MTDKPRRITKTTETLTDNIFTNDDKGTHLNGILLNDLSDHLPVFSISKINLHGPSGKNECYFTRRINNESIASFERQLEKTNRQEVINSNDCDEPYKLFMTTFHEVQQRKKGE